ncbi:hypothetical protein FXO38_23751 [Capsicum annuum]|nr:hypothetical protein FXO38_23751 [Capsicum annuum]KAF3642326.1 hypothetical protein FXO37_22572 [Capsicum annuum]
MLITRIILYYEINLSAYPVLEVLAIYDSKTFASIGYVLFDNEWCKKEHAENQPNRLRGSKSMSNPTLSPAKEIKQLKGRLTAIKEGIVSLQESTAKLLQLSKDTSTGMVKVYLNLDGFK